MIAFVAMTAPKQGFQILLHACCLDSSLPPPLTFQVAGIEARGEDSKTLCKARKEEDLVLRVVLNEDLMKVY